MPLKSIPSQQAGANVRRNPKALWPGGRRSAERLSGIVQATPTPSFQIEPTDHIMTIGSCFAREIEKALSARNFSLPALSLELPEEERVGSTPNEILNKYTIHAMANEIQWAFEPCPHAPEDLFVQAGDGLWHDPHLMVSMPALPLERIIDRREKVLSIMRRLPECKVVVVTLGLAESWYDAKLGLYLNVMPPQAALTAEPDRFKLVVLDYADIMDGIDRLCDLLQKYGRPDHKILMTVSPVPFKATFTGGDALIANTYSKSVQRAAAGAAAEKYANLDYFPSYEIVTLTDRSVAFRVDNIHVNPDVVSDIMRQAIASYVSGAKVEDSAAARKPAADKSRDPFGKNSILSAGYAALDAGDNLMAANHFSALLHRHQAALSPAQEQDCYRGLVKALSAADRLKEAKHSCLEWLDRQPENASAAAMIARLYEREKQLEKARSWAERAIALAPDNGLFHKRLATVYRKLGHTEAAEASTNMALQLSPELNAEK